MTLSCFHSIRPTFETSQSETLEWLVEAHFQAEKTNGMNEADLHSFRKTFQEKLLHVGCKPDRIEKRGHFLSDFLHKNWDEMEIYKLTEFAEGKDLSARSKCFQTCVDTIFETYYLDKTEAPKDLIHVSCTGYVSPSGAQKLVSKKNWGDQTTVTHSYHMGCYGAFPAIRMGLGFIKSGKTDVDIVHTELCALHSNPSLHRLDQLVSQSLFADGCMKYTLFPQSSLPHLKVIAMLEEIVPDSMDAMTWNVSNWGFEMTLAREIPVLIARALKAYLKKLCQLACIPYELALQTSFFAIHPGGPKILLGIQELLSLKDSQMSHSFQILKCFGNMSSATLPHIWQSILEDAAIPDKAILISLAFGPGLTISGSIMEKLCGS